MIFIGEKLNGTIPSIQKAILERDRGHIAKITAMQADAGADYIDVNAGTDPSREIDDMLWLLSVVREITDTPICVDSSAPETIHAALAELSGTLVMVNSINGDPKRLSSFLPLVAESNSEVIALCMDESVSGMPKNITERMEILARIFEATRAHGIDDGKVYVDPLIMAAATDTNAGSLAFECIRTIRHTYPNAHITGGLSNISYGMPRRAVLNRTFLTLAVFCGMDSAIVNPCDRELIASLKATDLLLGTDLFCRKYTMAAKKDFASKK